MKLNLTSDSVNKPVFFWEKCSSGVLPHSEAKLQLETFGSNLRSKYGTRAAATSVSFFPSKGILIRYTHSNAAIGSESLKNLHNQILTLKETIVSLEVLIKENEEKLLIDTEGIEGSSASEHEVFENIKVSDSDFIKLQEEYNKLIFKKHKV